MAGKSKNNTEVTNRETIYCTGCDHDKKPSDFYKSYGANKSGVLPYCKQCCIDMSLNDNGTLNIDKFKNMLSKVDRPFLYQTITDNLEKYPKIESAIGFYFKDLGMVQNRGLKYKDSIFENEENNKLNNINTVSYNISDNVIKKWGQNYTSEQIMKLENFYNDMQNSYDVKTASHKDYLKKISKVSLKMDEALDNDNVTEFQKLSGVYDNLMKSAKFTAVQRSAVDDTGGFATFCEFIESLEKEGFIEPAKIQEDYDIVEATISDIKNYTKKLVLGDSSISTMAVEQLNKMKEKQEEIDSDILDEELEGEENGINN
jgi:hypothetical protein